MNLEELKYPIGKFSRPVEISTETLDQYIQVIADFSDQLRQAVATLNNEQLNTAYRPDGWTIRQVVHHCADSHINSFIRFKLALTEDQPTIKPYHEDRWAELNDSQQMPIEPSLQMLEGTHQRWTSLLKSLNPTELERAYTHPESRRAVRLDTSVALYAWHCKHHLAHITNLKLRMGWE